MKVIKKNINNFSIFQNITEDRKTKIIEEIEKNKDDKLNRSVGSVIGMVIGDYVGALVEFSPATEVYNKLNIKYFDLKKMEYRSIINPFNLKWGQWTDDASMGMCMADSILICKMYNGSDIRQRFWNWWNNGYNNAFRLDKTRFKSVGLGGNINKSLSQIKLNTIPSPIYVPNDKKDTDDAGNGSLMRLAPVPVAFSDNLDDAVKYSKLSSKTTHPSEKASDACGLTGYIIASAINRDSQETVKQFLERVTREYLEKYNPCTDIKRLIESNEDKTSKEVSWNWKSDLIEIDRVMNNRGKKYKGYPNSSSYYGSYSIDGLAIALNSVYTTNSFTEAIEKCISYLGDADSTGSITGQIAGAFYGYNTIDHIFINSLYKWDGGDNLLRGYYLNKITFE